ncbi:MULTISPECIES: hypothetical protein [Mycolicibacterium]|uniref:hypothetical protein n=1 Tax=Mycolicibacterium TaxID=1866885 RepID=UPI001E619140|nr:hypothetical protein [Mycolicibacterium mageritense]MBN3458258.1 hypothetical protein [Mycobacterium sp. DSM 3803]GJJ21156.1 hypothetical protein MTY414_48290 [Mycolicibacterium mageritense]
MTGPLNTSQNALREEILDAALHDWVPMIEIDQIVTQQRLAADDAERFNLVTAVVRVLLEEGLVSVGNLPGDATQVPDWGLPIGGALARLRDEYVVRHSEPSEWEYRIWIGLTAKGRAAAELLAENR